jgi:acylphosphatase
MITRRLFVHGRVQGVFYRGWTIEQARALGLAGWVRNRQDRSVEILAIGEEDPLEALAAACRHGPPGAVVRSLDAAPAEDDGSQGFVQKATA